MYIARCFSMTGLGVLCVYISISFFLSWFAFFKPNPTKHDIRLLTAFVILNLLGILIPFQNMNDSNNNNDDNDDNITLFSVGGHSYKSLAFLQGVCILYIYVVGGIALHKIRLQMKNMGKNAVINAFIALIITMFFVLPSFMSSVYFTFSLGQPTTTATGVELVHMNKQTESQKRRRISDQRRGKEMEERIKHLIGLIEKLQGGKQQLAKIYDQYSDPVSYEMPSRPVHVRYKDKDDSHPPQFTRHPYSEKTLKSWFQTGSRTSPTTRRKLQVVNRREGWMFPQWKPSFNTKDNLELGQQIYGKLQTLYKKLKNPQVTQTLHDKVTDVHKGEKTTPKQGQTKKQEPPSALQQLMSAGGGGGRGAGYTVVPTKDE